MKQRLFGLFILPCWVKAFPMVRAFFIHVCFSVLIKEPDDEDDANADVACQA